MAQKPLVFSVSNKTSVETSVQVVNALDRVIQPKFQEDAGDFGAARLGIGGHDRIADAKTVTALLKQIKSSTGTKHPDYTIGFFTLH